MTYKSFQRRKRHWNSDSYDSFKQVTINRCRDWNAATINKAWQLRSIRRNVLLKSAIFDLAAVVFHPKYQWVLWLSGRNMGSERGSVLTQSAIVWFLKPCWKNHVELPISVIIQISDIGKSTDLSISENQNDLPIGKSDDFPISVNRNDLPILKNLNYRYR